MMRRTGRGLCPDFFATRPQGRPSLKIFQADQPDYVVQAGLPDYVVQAGKSQS
jgi:hypothetical protein